MLLNLALGIAIQNIHHELQRSLIFSWISSEWQSCHNLIEQNIVVLFTKLAAIDVDYSNYCCHAVFFGIFFFYLGVH